MVKKIKLALISDNVVEKPKKIKVRLPKSYIHILKEKDGGYINYYSFPFDVPTIWSDNNMNVEHMKAKIAKYDYYIDISSYRLIIDDDNHFHLKHLKTLRQSQWM